MRKKADPTTNKRGQAIGNKGDRSRQRLMDAAFEVLKNKSVWEISVTDICATCKVAPSNLYTYFSGADEVVLALGRQVSEKAPPLVEVLSDNWEGRAGFAQARRFVDLEFAYWAAYRPVLKVVELLGDEGNAAYNEVRRSRLRPVYEAMVPLIVKAQKQGLIHRRIDPMVGAICAMGLIESAAMHAPLVVKLGHVKHQNVLETHVRLLLLHLTGRSAA